MQRHLPECNLPCLRYPCTHLSVPAIGHRFADRSRPGRLHRWDDKNHHTYSRIRLYLSKPGSHEQSLWESETAFYFLLSEGLHTTFRKFRNLPAGQLPHQRRCLELRLFISISHVPSDEASSKTITSNSSEAILKSFFSFFFSISHRLYVAMHTLKIMFPSILYLTTRFSYECCRYSNTVYNSELLLIFLANNFSVSSITQRPLFCDF